MGRFTSWIVEKERRDILAFLGGGVVVVAGAVWTTFTYFSPKPVAAPASSPLIEATYKVCRGDKEDKCPPGTVHIACSSSFGAWARTECGDYEPETTLVSGAAGGMCGYQVVEIKCSGRAK